MHVCDEKPKFDKPYDRITCGRFHNPLHIYDVGFFFSFDACFFGSPMQASANFTEMSINTNME